MAVPNSNNPDVLTCRASHSGHGGLVFCLNEERFLCDHCLPFGEAYFCRHPESKEIVARTEALKKQKPVHG